jgi:hypothetical protein
MMQGNRHGLTLGRVRAMHRWRFRRSHVRQNVVGQRKVHALANVATVVTTYDVETQWN